MSEQVVLSKRTFWLVVALVVVSLAFGLMAALNVSLYYSNRRQDADLRVAKEKIAAQEKLEASRKQAKVLAGYAECKARIAGTDLGNGILEELRGVFTDLSTIVKNPVVAQSLHKHAVELPHFPKPTCKTGPPKQATP